MSRALFCSIVLSLCAGTALAEGEADWLRRMDAALAREAFQGVLVFRRGVELDVLRVGSQPSAHGRVERFDRLTGRVELLTRGDGALHINGELLSPEAVSAPFLPDPSDLTQLGGYYDVSVRGADRVAGRETVLLELRARDAFRFSQQLLLDSQTGLPLRSRILALGDSVVEEWLFADIQLGSSGLVGASVPSPSNSASLQPASARQAGFQMVDAPRGFGVALSGPGVDGNGEQVVYSDGLVTVSVYVEPLRADRPNLSGTHRRGAMTVVGRVADRMQITVVGAVPPVTAERFAQGVVPNAPG